jgi:hypothetical protein
MNGWGMWIFGFVVIVALNVIANMMAQKLHPTLSNDSVGRRVSYRVVFAFSMFVLLGICVLMLFALDSVGYRL